jgi:hypothetical protein
MGFNINDFKFNLERLFGEGAKFPLLKVAKWEDNVTKAQVGFKYNVASEEFFAKFSVKIGENKPVITNEELMKSESRVYVTFTNTVVTFYGDSVFNADISVTAAKAAIVKNDAPVEKSTAVKR